MSRGLIFAAILWALSASSAGSEEIDAMTGLPARGKSFTPLPVVTGGINVLWDLTHGVYLNYQPTGDFSNLVTLLAANGYVVTTTSAGIDNIDLSPYTILVISVGSAWDSPYTPQEVAAVQSFVASGRGLLVMADNPSTNNANISPVTSAFGTTCAVASLPDDLTFTNFGADPIFTGIGSIYYRASGSLNGSAPSVELAFADSGQPTVTGVGPCSIVVTGDINFCDNVYHTNADNDAFALNIFDALAGIHCVVPVQPSTWGAIKANYR